MSLKKLLPILCVICLLAGCSVSPAGRDASDPDRMTENSVSFFAMDTYMNIRAYGADDDLLQSVTSRVSDLETLLSATDGRSEISALNNGEAVTLSDDTMALLGRALEICHKCAGALDISVYPIVKAWGFTTGEYRVPDSAEIAELLKNVDYRKISAENGSVTLPDGMEIDLGSIAKGYTGDQIISILKEGGVTSALLDLGGNIQTLGAKPDGSPWRVAVQDPEGSDVIGVLSVSDKAVITSGGYQRYFTDEDGNIRWHIMDPATGYPARSGLISVTIIGSEGVSCDALSTALFVMGLDTAVEFWKGQNDFEMILVTEDDIVYITPGVSVDFEPVDGLGYEFRVIGND